MRLRVGPGESGKSTIFKQMKIISMAGGFTREELMAYKHVIYGNCVTQMKVIVHAASKLGIEMASEDNAVRVSSSSSTSTIHLRSWPFDCHLMPNMD